METSSFWAKRERERTKAYSLGEESIFGVAISPSFGVLLDQVKEGKKEEKEKKRIKVRKFSPLIPCYAC